MDNQRKMTLGEMQEDKVEIFLPTQHVVDVVAHAIRTESPVVPLDYLLATNLRAILHNEVGHD